MKALLILALAGTVGVDAPAGTENEGDNSTLYDARCGGCHALDAHRTGPSHAGLFGRRAGSAPGFSYSPALARSGIIWNADTLDRWLTNPEALVPGQRMNVRVDDAQERARIINFLKTAR